MADALFWWTGAVVWAWVVLMGVSMMVINAHDRFLHQTGSPKVTG